MPFQRGSHMSTKGTGNSANLLPLAQVRVNKKTRAKYTSLTVCLPGGCFLYTYAGGCTGGFCKDYYFNTNTGAMTDGAHSAGRKVLCRKREDTVYHTKYPCACRNDGAYGCTQDTICDFEQANFAQDCKTDSKLIGTCPREGDCSCVPNVSTLDKKSPQQCALVDPNSGEYCYTGEVGLSCYTGIKDKDKKTEGVCTEQMFAGVDEDTCRTRCTEVPQCGGFSYNPQEISCVLISTTDCDGKGGVFTTDTTFYGKTKVALGRSTVNTGLAFGVECAFIPPFSVTQPPTPAPKST
jgi:hypothetical protein